MFKNYRIGQCYIIAEIGGNFTTFEQAKELIDAAYNCGVDCVKLQTYRADTISSKSAMFDMENVGTTSQHELFKQYEINENLHQSIFEYAESKKLDWFSTPSHKEDVDLLERCGVGAHKIGSDDAVNYPFLKYIAQTGRPMILSTGMCTMEDVRGSVDIILGEGNDQLILLHAVTSYPTHPENVNLRAIEALKKEFPSLTIGYSDHTTSPIASLCAVALGAQVIERHFTCDKQAHGPDHMLSADPEEMKWLVNGIRSFEKMKGTGIKMPAKSEKTTRINNRKSIILAKELRAGDIISSTSITIKRPGHGIQPKYFEQLIGRSVCKDLVEDSVLSWSDLG